VQFDIQVAEASFWIGGITLALLGLLFLSETLVGGVLGIITGIAALPPVNSSLMERLEVNVGSEAVAGVVILLAAESEDNNNIEAGQSEPTSVEQHHMNEQFTIKRRLTLSRNELMRY